MAIQKQILNLPKRRTTNTLQKLLESWNSGELGFESDLLGRLTDEYAKLFSGIRAPLLTPEPMRLGEDFLRVSALRNPLLELDEDLEASYEQLELLRSAVIEMQNLTASDKAGLEELLSQAQHRIVEAKVWTNDSDANYLWASDTFKTMSKIDEANTTTRVDNKLGIATLAITGELPLNDKISKLAIKHVDENTIFVDGIPGNNLEIISDTAGDLLIEEQEPTNPLFVADNQGDSTNPASMFDGKPATWFEWEKYLVPQTQPVKPAGSAWIYRQDGEKKGVFGESGLTLNYGWQFKIKWPGSEEAVTSTHWIVTPTDITPTGKPTKPTTKTSFGRSSNTVEPTTTKTPELPAETQGSLVISVDFSIPQPLSWIELLPFLPHSSSAYQLYSIQVSPDGVGDWTELIVGPPIILNPDLDQPLDPSTTGIAVKDYTGKGVVPCHLSQVKAIKLDLRQDKPLVEETLIAHKYYLKSTTTQSNKKYLFGLFGSSKTTTNKIRVQTPEMNPPNSSGGSGGGFLGGLIGGLFGSSSKTVTDTDLDTFYDIFQAYRYCIGVRELGLYQRQYSESSILTSKTYYFEKPIIAASLISSETIPPTWDSNTRWITYEFSHDGVAWQEVIPINLGGVDSSVIHFPPTNKLTLRVKFLRPGNDAGGSPVLQYYTIKALPKGVV